MRLVAARIEFLAGALERWIVGKCAQQFVVGLPRFVGAREQGVDNPQIGAACRLFRGHLLDANAIACHEGDLGAACMELPHQGKPQTGGAASDGNTQVGQILIQRGIHGRSPPRKFRSSCCGTYADDVIIGTLSAPPKRDVRYIGGTSMHGQNGIGSGAPRA